MRRNPTRNDTARHAIVHLGGRVMSRRGMVAKRCRVCGRRVADKRCSKCGADSVGWSYTIDTGPVGGTRRQRSKSGFKTKREAVAALTQVQGAIGEGTYVEPSRQTLADFLESDWLPAIQSTIRPSTFRSYEQHVRTYIGPRIGHIRLQALDGGIINGLYADLLASGRVTKPGTLSASTVRRIHSTLHRSLRDAVKWGRLTRNPTDQADPPRPGMGGSTEMKTWTAQELARFLAHVRDDRLYAMWVLAATTGMRRGEVLGLKWDDIDLATRRLSVRRTLISLGGEVHQSEPKTKRGKRQLALDTTTTAALKEWRRTQAQDKLALGPGWSNSGWVFTREDGTPIHPEHFSRAFDQKVREARLPRIRPHDLRHTHATLALQAGIHPKVVSERLGHATVAITMDTYTHAVPALDEEAAERIAALVFHG